MINSISNWVFLFFITLISVVMYGQNEFEQYTVFNSGEAGFNSYRIPVIVTTNNGTLIAACEARKESWRDKSPTDIAVKRSTDGGKTWSIIKFVTNGWRNRDAYMDPCLLSDNETGKVFLFACRWPESPQDGTENVPFLMTSTDDGLTWSKPVSVKESFTLFSGYINGFGPGAGIQMQGEKYKGRLIVPIRLMDAATQRNRAVYSDDHGETWTIGGRAQRVGEFQIAELPESRLYYNCRISGGRASGYSENGGVTWGGDKIDSNLPSIENGCQSSVMSIGNVLFYSGIEGATPIAPYDDRSKLKLFKSLDGGASWVQNYLLYEKAAGYSCLTQLKNGDIAILFEAGDQSGFTKAAVRPAGWLRLDLMIIPAKFLDLDTSTKNISLNNDFSFSLTPDRNQLLIKNVENSNVKIISLMGIVLKNERIINGMLDISDLQKGVYVINMGNKNKTFIK